jgi:hypothetical protein
MTVAFVRVGTSASVAAGTTLACPYPATVDPDDLLFLASGVKPSSRAYTALPGSWAAWVTKTGGAGAAAVDTGPTRAAFSWLTAVGNEDGLTETVTVSGTPSPLIVLMLEFSKTGAGAWDVTSSTGDDAATGTGAGSYSAVMAADPGFTSGDMVAVVISSPTDAGTFTNQSLSIPGCTVGSLTERVNATTAAGNDGSLRVYTANITAGTSTGAATFTADSDDANAGAGPAIIVRLREPAGTSATGTDTASGADSATMSAALPAADSSSAADTAALAVQISAGDTATVTDAASVGNPVGGADAGTGADSAAIAAALAASDGGSVADTASVSVAITVNQPAAAADAAALTASVAAVDTAAAAAAAAVTTGGAVTYGTSGWTPRQVPSASGTPRQTPSAQGG